MSGSDGTRSKLVEAMVHIVGARGFEGLSVRAVAARAGVSAGAVQHHFPTKTAMLGAAMSAIVTVAAGRDDDVELIADPAERLHAVVDLLIPRSADSLVARVWVAFAAHAVVDTATREVYRNLWGRTRAGLRLLIAACGQPESADEKSAELLALLDGLALSIVAEQTPEMIERARVIAHRRTDELTADTGSGI